MARVLQSLETKEALAVESVRPVAIPKTGRHPATAKEAPEDTWLAMCQYNAENKLNARLASGGAHDNEVFWVTVDPYFDDANSFIHFHACVDMVQRVTTMDKRDYLFIWLRRIKSNLKLIKMVVANHENNKDK